MISPNRKGQVKDFKECDVEAAKALGWVEKDKTKVKAKKKKGSK
jgi:hypothetical protein